MESVKSDVGWMSEKTRATEARSEVGVLFDKRAADRKKKVGRFGERPLIRSSPSRANKCRG